MPGRGYRIQRVAGALAKSVMLGLAFYFGFPERFAYQDTLSLMQRAQAPAKRWMTALKAGGNVSDITPTMTMAQGSGETSPGNSADVSDGASHRPTYRVVAQGRDGTTTIMRGIDASLVAGGVIQVPDIVRTNSADKGNRLVSLAPDRQMIDSSAGSVYAMASLIGAEPANSLPRVAFVEPQAIPRNSMMASNAPTRRDGKPLNLTKMLMARGAAAAGFSSLSAYAPSAVEDTKLPFAALFGMPPGPTPEEEAVDKDNPHWWASNPLPASVILPKEQRCLAEAIYFEARGENEDGQAAVAQVVLNRVKNPAYPSTVCKVVYQNQSRRNACQFSFACDGLSERVANNASWRTAKKLARELISGKHWQPKVGASTHYHATYVRPRWARRMNRRAKIGEHIFYETKGGGWS